MSDSSLTDLYTDLSQSPEFTVHEMMDQIRYQLRRRIAEVDGMTQAALAAEMGVAPSVVSRLLRAAENTSLLTIARAARALGLTFKTIKFVPDEDAALQADEFGALLRAEGTGHGWWPRTRRVGTYAWRHTPHAFARSSNPAVPSPSLSRAEPSPYVLDLGLAVQAGPTHDLMSS